MGKRERHKEDLSHLLDEYLQRGDDEKILDYLASNSNLPGRRANLELADAFAEAAEAYSRENKEGIWRLCIKLIGYSQDEAPLNTPLEFLPFCGTYAIGAVASAHPGLFEESLSQIRRNAEDPRWRLREAVAFGIQKLLSKESEKTLKTLEGWIEDDEWLAMRAVAAGVADPSLLRNPAIAMRALELHKVIFDRIIASSERESDDFKTLRKGLGYTLSVVVCAIPWEGFEYLRQLVELQDSDVAWIIRENLKKKRLIKNFPERVDSIRELLGKLA